MENSNLGLERVNIQNYYTSEFFVIDIDTSNTIQGIIK